MNFPEAMLVLMAVIAVGLFGAGLLKVGLAMDDITKAIRDHTYRVYTSQLRKKIKGLGDG